MIKDKDIRFNFIKNFKQDNENKDYLIVNELGLCKSDAILDIAYIGSYIHGYEIKSEADTLVRLKNQMEVYNKCLKYITIITCKNHLKKVLEIVPDFWGVILAYEENELIKFEYIRKEKENNLVDKHELIKLLWHEETLNILNERNLSKGVKSKSKDILWNRLSENVTLEELEIIITNTLKNRDDWKKRKLIVKRKRNS